MKPYPKRKAVTCNGNKGIYIVDRQVICCLCEQCSTEAKARGLEELELSPTDFERHSGNVTILRTEDASDAPCSHQLFAIVIPLLSCKSWVLRSVLPYSQQILGVVLLIIRFD